MAKAKIEIKIGTDLTALSEKEIREWRRAQREDLNTQDGNRYKTWQDVTVYLFLLTSKDPPNITKAIVGEPFEFESKEES